MSAEEPATPETIVTLRIDLVDTDPPIWREVELPVSMTLKQVHAVIQAVLGWQGSHLWEFTDRRRSISSSQAAKLRLELLLGPGKTVLGYLYDFGDSWEHRLTFTKPRAADPSLAYPRYVRGAQAAPPEDCGGIPGFYAQLDILADPTHEDYEEAKEWFGDFDPAHLDEHRLADRLAKLAVRRARSASKSKARR